MEPLSPRVRRTFLFVSLALWLMLVPVVIFFADGWRFKYGYGFVQTGGIFVWAPYSDTEISINGSVEGITSFLNRGLYVSDLAPSAYDVSVSKEGYRNWERTVVVEPLLVSDVRVLLVPEEIELTLLSSQATATSTSFVPEERLEAFTAVFAATSSASSTVPVSTQDSVGLFINEKKDLIARWLGGGTPPSTFCGRPSYCQEEIVLDRESVVTRAFFFGGGVVYRTNKGVINFVEVDIRPESMRVPLYEKAGADVSLINGELIIKDGSRFLRVGAF